MWKDIKGYDGKYQISKDGIVRSLCKKGCVLKTGGNNTGYRQVILYKDGKSKKHYIHRLLAKAFIPNACNKPHVNHINAIRDDNRLENLEWVTASENQIHAVNIGTKTFYKNEENPFNKSISQYTKKGEFVKRYYSIRKASKDNGLDIRAFQKYV